MIWNYLMWIQASQSPIRWFALSPRSAIKSICTIISMRLTDSFVDQVWQLYQSQVLHPHIWGKKSTLWMEFYSGLFLSNFCSKGQKRTAVLWQCRKRVHEAMQQCLCPGEALIKHYLFTLGLIFLWCRRLTLKPAKHRWFLDSCIQTPLPVPAVNMQRLI